MPIDLHKSATDLLDSLIETYGEPPHGAQLKQIWLYFDDEGYTAARCLCIYHRKSDEWYIYLADSYGTALVHRFSDISSRMLKHDEANRPYMRYVMAEDGTWQLKVWAGLTELPSPAPAA
jgi:hypothetical protein